MAPFACAEVGFLYLEEGDLDRAKEYLNKARYKTALKNLYAMELNVSNFIETSERGRVDRRPVDVPLIDFRFGV